MLPKIEKIVTPGNFGVFIEGMQLWMRRFRVARADLEHLLAQNQFVGDATFQLARLEMLTGKYGAAEKRLRAMGNQNPADDRVKVGLANLYVASGRPQDAKSVLASRVESFPERLDYRYDLARFLARINENADAIRELEAIVKKQPGYQPAQTLLGELLLRQNDIESARQHFLTAIKGNHPSPDALVHMGTLMARESKYNQARDYLEKALAIRPNNPTANNNLAYILAETNTELDQALTCAQRATAAAPDNAAFADTLALVYIKRDLYDRAITVLSGIVASHPDQVPFRYHYALALFRSGKREQAKTELETALKHRPKPEEANQIRELLAKIGS